MINQKKINILGKEKLGTRRVYRNSPQRIQSNTEQIPSHRLSTLLFYNNVDNLR